MVGASGTRSSSNTFGAQRLRWTGLRVRDSSSGSLLSFAFESPETDTWIRSHILDTTFLLIGCIDRAYWSDEAGKERAMQSAEHIMELIDKMYKDSLYKRHISVADIERIETARDKITEWRKTHPPEEITVESVIMLRRDPYEVLELLPGASMDDIKSAYRRLAKEIHPDMVTNPAKKGEAAAKFIELQLAYDALTGNGNRAYP